MNVRIATVDAATTRELRRSVLRPATPSGVPVHGDEATDAVHLAAFDDDTLVGACLLLPRPYPLRAAEPGAWQLRGMATAPAYQRRDVGATVLDAAVVEVRRRRGRLLWCDARTSAVAFYGRHGFIAEGDEFLHAESGIPHRRMVRVLDLRDAPGLVRGECPTR